MNVLLALVARLAVEGLQRLGVWPLRVIAVAVPVAVSTALVVAMVQPIPRCQQRCELTEQLDGALRAHDPRLVVVGNSMARRNVDVELLAEGLGQDPDRSALLTLPGSSPGAWYALLRYRVFERGYRPRKIVLLGASRLLWITRPVVGADVSAVVRIAGTEDPVVRRVSGMDDTGRILLYRANLHRRMWRASVVDGLAQGARTLQAMVGVPVDEQMEDVFGAGGGPQGGGLRNLFGGAVRDGEVGVAADVASTFLPEILALCRQYHAELVVVRMPPRDASKVEFLESRPEALRDVASWLGAEGVPFYPMDGLEIPADEWDDAWHLAPAGAVRFTDALVAAMTGPAGGADGSEAEVLEVRAAGLHEDQDRPDGEAPGGGLER
ncbi:MAG: hypothetical protein H6738_05585 [Alphaproteobacteria bacterium]|nr:hypothetical protein [Alphaproteobacteria bacterium]MCB9696240.1 hypothetical protein [Alphaproteobacteria bacterium]